MDGSANGNPPTAEAPPATTAEAPPATSAEAPLAPSATPAPPNLPLEERMSVVRNLNAELDAEGEGASTK